MSHTYHLLRRNGVWSYRRRVPTHLVPAFGKKEIQFSLATRSLKEAKKRRAAEDLKWSTRFEAAEKDLGGGARDNTADVPAEGRPLSRRDVIRLVQEYVERTDERARDRLLRDPPESEEQEADIRADVEMSQQILRNRDDPRADELIYSAGQKILRRAGLSMEDDPIPYAEFAEVVRRALLELDHRQLARLDDDHRPLVFDPQFSPTRAPQVTFGELADQFLQLKEEDAAVNRTSRKWVEKQRANVALLRAIIGDATPLRDVDYDACLRVRSVLARLPAYRTKTYKGLTVDEAIARAKADRKPQLAPFTQERYLATLKAILDLAAKKRLIAVNLAEGVRPLKRDEVASADKRDPFTLKQIVQFFHCDFYQQCATSGPAPYRFDKTGGWRFWLPPVCLFAVLRPNEVCQLHLDDIQRTDQGTWYFDLVASNEDDGAAVAKTLKSASSRRRVPIHPELIAMGLLQFVEDKRKSGATRLFPKLNPDKYGNYAWYPSKKFNESFLPEAIALTERQTFYSFRHSARDALRRIGAPPDVLQALGWSQGKLVSDDYGDKSNPDHLLHFVKQISYPGLDLTPLYVKDSR
jgi:integrase